LRISGETLDIDSLLSQCPLAVDRSWKKGEPRSPNGRLHSDSGANVIASEADLDAFERQVIEATEFLTLHATDIAQIAVFPGVQNAVLDFGISLKVGYFTQFSYLPPRLIQLAASAGIGIEISHYACGDEDSSRANVRQPAPQDKL
jgi:hypothetical protein